jgi:hypothetical protein
VAVLALAGAGGRDSWRADHEATRRLLLDGRFTARAAAIAPRTSTRLAEPYPSAAIEDAAGNRAGRALLQDAVREPASPKAGGAGEYYAVNLDDPARALPILRALY